MADSSNGAFFAELRRKELRRALRRRLQTLLNCVLLVALTGFCIGMWGAVGRNREQLARASSDPSMASLQRASIFVSRGVLLAREKSTLLLGRFTGSHAGPAPLATGQPPIVEPGTTESQLVANPIAEPKPTQGTPPSTPESPTALAVTPQPTPAGTPQDTEVLPSGNIYQIAPPDTVKPPQVVTRPPKPRVSADVEKLLAQARAEHKIADRFYQSARPEASAAGRGAATLQCKEHAGKAREYYQQALKRSMPAAERKLVEGQLRQIQQMYYWMSKFSPVR